MGPDVMDLFYEHDDLPASGDSTWWYYSRQHGERRPVDIRLTFVDLDRQALIAQERALRSFLEQNCQWQLPKIDICGWIYAGDLPEPELSDPPEEPVRTTTC